MSNYKHQELDFINRTKTIITQYNSHVPQKNKFEVTLLLNCFVGLLILPQQCWFDRLPLDLTSRKEWGIDPAYITITNKKEPKRINNIARHLRNSVAHYNFKVFSNHKNELSRIYFRDLNRQGVKTFEATIPIDNLRQFIDKFSSIITKEMEKEKQKHQP